MSSRPHFHNSTTHVKDEGNFVPAPHSTWPVAVGLYGHPPGCHLLESARGLSGQAYWRAVQRHVTRMVNPWMPTRVIHSPPLWPQACTVLAQLPPPDVASPGVASDLANPHLEGSQPHQGAHAHSATAPTKFESLAKRDRWHNSGAESPSSFNNGAQHQNGRQAALGRIRSEELVAGNTMLRSPPHASSTGSSAVEKSTPGGENGTFAAASARYYQGRQGSLSSEGSCFRFSPSFSSGPGPSSSTATTPENATHAPFNPSCLSFETLPPPLHLGLVDRAEAVQPSVTGSVVNPIMRRVDPAEAGARVMPIPMPAMPSTSQYEGNVGEVMLSSNSLAWEWITRVLDSPEDEWVQRSEQDWYRSMKDA
ncbi:hypothetical protein PYCCODRAFT_1438917 [Trametes coccinea BRFM310]|uniref:Uncharacterized protein n=1 Tax=Trametes coccinea (strain BRFM310) TaxID=1353009 RepID=A0A1Y2ICE9_TRAC3|nr:hypothetical protein PYCCODRAFT_1438917 [Trametes coccinea BRFM310]